MARFPHMAGARLALAAIASLLLPWPPGAGAHEGPFRVYASSQDRLVAAQLPGHCLTDGVLLCHRYSPVLRDRAMKTGLEPRDKTRPASTPAPIFPARGGIVKLTGDGLCLVAGDPGFARADRYELLFSLADCRGRGGRRPAP